MTNLERRIGHVGTEPKNPDAILKIDSGSQELFDQWDAEVLDGQVIVNASLELDRFVIADIGQGQSSPDSTFSFVEIKKVGDNRISVINHYRYGGRIDINDYELIDGRVQLVLAR